MNRMNPKSGLLQKLLILFILLGTVANAQSFEGKIDLQAGSRKVKKGALTPITYFAKENKARINIVQQGMETNLLIKDKLIYMVIPSMQSYMEFDPSTIKTKSKDSLDVVIDKTDETKEIAGYTATKWVIGSKKDVMEVWVTDKLGCFLLTKTLGDQDASMKAITDAFGKTFFPLQMIQIDSKGEKSTLLEVTKVTLMKVDDNYFDIPEGYQLMDMHGNQ